MKPRCPDPSFGAATSSNVGSTTVLTGIVGRVRLVSADHRDDEKPEPAWKTASMAAEESEARSVVPRPATMRDIADHVGVSRQLVSLVLRGMGGPSDDSKQRILTASRELGYRPNQSARLLRQRRSRLVGLLFAMQNPFEVRVAEGLFARAATAGFGLVLGPTTAGRPVEAVVEELLEARVEGVIGFNVPTTAVEVASAAALVPFVLLGERAPEAVHDNVFVDEEAGLRLAVDHLVGLGHRDIVYLGGHPGRVGAARADSYRAAMDAAGLADHAEVVESDFWEESGASATRTLLARASWPTAIIACGDQSAAGAMGVLTRAGVQVPAEISLVGFDDSDVASRSYLAMTSVRQDVDLTADEAWDALTQRLADPAAARRSIATRTTLTVRGSTGPASR